MYPFEILLVIPFIHLGSRLFHTAPLPLSPSSLLQAARRNPIALTRQLWLWEWHAWLLWASVAIVGVPLLALALTPLLRRLLLRVNRHQYPVLPMIERHDSTTLS
jgi:hypothetical protein